jgi:hypothetical protein
MDRADSLPCQHPNVLGCPNHGALARLVLREIKAGNSPSVEFMEGIAPDSAWPIVQVLDLGGIDLVLWDWPTLDTLS